MTSSPRRTARATITVEWRRHRGRLRRETVERRDSRRPAAAAYRAEVARRRRQRGARAAGAARRSRPGGAGPAAGRDGDPQRGLRCEGQGGFAARAVADHGRRGTARPTRTAVVARPARRLVPAGRPQRLPQAGLRFAPMLLLAPHKHGSGLGALLGDLSGHRGASSPGGGPARETLYGAPKFTASGAVGDAAGTTVRLRTLRVDGTAMLQRARDHMDIVDPDHRDDRHERHRDEEFASRSRLLRRRGRW